MYYLFTALICALSGVAFSVVQEGVSIQPSATFGMYDSKDRDDGQKDASTGDGYSLMTNTGVGYTVSSGIFVGAKLLTNFGSSNSQYTSSSSGESKTQTKDIQFGYGPSIGYESASGFFMSAAYIMEANDSVKWESQNDRGTSTTEVKYTDNRIVIGDVSYFFSYGKMRLGPQLVYMRKQYHKTTIESKDNKGVESTDESTGDYSRSFISPYFALSFKL